MTKPRFTRTYLLTIVTEGSEIPHMTDFITQRLWSLENEGGRVVDMTAELVVGTGAPAPALTSPSQPVPKIENHPDINVYAEPREVVSAVLTANGYVQEPEQASGIGDIHCTIEMPHTAAALRSGNGATSIAPMLVNMDACEAIAAEGLNRTER